MLESVVNCNMKSKNQLTRRDIADSLIMLMKEKDFEKITNKNIAERAGVSHMTIYRNFRSKDDIIKFYLDEITDDFIEKSKIVYDPNDFNGYLVTLFEHLLNTKEIGLLLYRADLIHYIKDEFDRIFLSKAHNQRERYHYYFLAGGLYNVYFYWIKSGCKETPRELANMFTDFYILKGTMS